MKLLLTDLAYLHHNYGAQGILLPFIENISKKMDVEFTVTVSNRIYQKQDKQFAIDKGFNLFFNPRLSLSTFFKIPKLKKLKEYRKLIKEHDVIIDLSGIEFIGNISKMIMWKNLINTIYTQKIAYKFNKKYFKFTKSYGPFENSFYTKIVKTYLNKLAFLYVRGDQNLKVVNQLELKIPIYSFPDISLALNPASEKWAKDYLNRMIPDFTKVIGLSPSVVIRNITNVSNMTSGEDHIVLCKNIISRYKTNDQPILIIPHSIGNGKDLKTCDLALAKKIYTEVNDKENLYILEDENLTYQQVRALIGQLSFYITSRYHSLASALKMHIPTISLSWHIKYEDIMRSYLAKFLAIDCRTKDVKVALELINDFYIYREWFSKDLLIQKQKEIELKIEKSIDLIVEDIKKV